MEIIDLASIAGFEIIVNNPASESRLNKVSQSVSQLGAVELPLLTLPVDIQPHNL